MLLGVMSGWPRRHGGRQNVPMGLMVTGAAQPSKPNRLDRCNSRAFRFCTDRKAVTVSPYSMATGAEKLLTVSNNAITGNFRASARYWSRISPASDAADRRHPGCSFAVLAIRPGR